MNRSVYIVGNWKMHMLSKETDEFIQQLIPLINGISCRVYLAPPYTSIAAAYLAARGSGIRIGAQNMSEYPKGAYTGEISASMLKEAGARFVILGHSERRSLFHESDQIIHRKLKWALEEEIKPILCIGESSKERNEGLTHSVLERQIKESLKELPSEKIRSVSIAYEPIWAIGTGKSATPQIAEETHLFCRRMITQVAGKEVAEQIPILYGGSVKPENIGDLIKQPNIDGALVGGASLSVETFAKIIHLVDRG